MKNFKDLISEVAIDPKAPEEKRFKDQHTIEVTPHPVAPDHVFTGEIPGLTDGDKTIGKQTEAEYDKAYKKKVSQTLPQRGTGAGKPVASVTSEETSANILKKSITEILGVAAKKAAVKDDETTDDGDMEETKGEHDKELKAEKQPVKKAETKEDAGANKDSLEPEAKPINKSKPSPTQVTIKDSNGKTLSMTFKEMLSKVSTEEELLESPQQEIPMMMKQLHFICYASEEIGDYLKMEGQDPEEWWQNKLAEVFSNVKSLYAYAKGDQMLNTKPLSASKMFRKAGMAYEEIQPGDFELQNESVIEVSEEDANILNRMFGELTETNTKEMYSVLIADEAGYNEILEFAKGNV
jgi:hypothetical protein